MTDTLIPFPDIFVEIGILPDSPVQSSTVLRLDDATLGLLNTATLGTSIEWTDISDDVLNFTVTRPSTRQQGPLWNYQAGTCTILLDNSSGNYDPDNLSGPFVLGGATLLTAMVPVRVRAAFSLNYYLYSGFSDGWVPGEISTSGDYAELTLSATDAFKVFAGINLPAISITGVGADAGARIKDILLRVGWYTSMDRQSINTGNSALQGTTLGADALSAMQIAVDSEIGQLYQNGYGAVVFRSRHAPLTDSRSNTVQAVFGDSPGTVHPAGTELPLASVSRASDDTTVANDIQATNLGGSLQEVKDSASIAKYLFPRVYQRSDLILQSDTDALHWAQYVLYISKGGENRIESITIDPQANPAVLWPQVLGREIGDRIQVWVRPPNLPSPISKDCFITAITHTCDAVNYRWSTQWVLQDASKYGSFMTLDNSTLGQLDENALAF